MTSESKPIRPAPDQDGPTLDEAFQYELKRRSSLGGIAQAALGGDRDALASFAGASAVLVERASEREQDPQFADLADWLAFCLSRIAAGEEPNDAFGWTRQGKGRPSVTKSDFQELTKRWVIGQSIAGDLISNPTLSEAEALRAAAARYHVSPETARNAWEQWQGKKPVK